MFGFLKKLFAPAPPRLSPPTVDPPKRKRREPAVLFGLDELARRVGENATELQQFKASYREAHIPKKSGGTRRLLIPDPELKALQKRILRRLLSRLRIHPLATGFEKGKSIVHNAAPHVGQSVVIKLDIVNFFPSCKAARVETFFRYLGWDEESVAILKRVCTHEGGLPQGAPTSPRLSNLIHIGLDKLITRRVWRYKGQYTRYADDITISFPKDYPRRIGGTIQQVKRIAKHFGLHVHTRKKMRVLRRHQQQRITGLVVNEKIQLPRKTRRRLRAIRHHLAVGRSATMTAEQLAGWTSFQAMVEKASAAVSSVRIKGADQLEGAWVAYHQGHFSVAVDLFSKCIKRQPSAELFACRAECWRALFEYGPAQIDFSVAIRLQPLNASLYCGRAEMSIKMNHDQAALADYSEALRLHPIIVTALRQRALLHRRQGEYYKAIHDLNEVVRLRPTSPTAYYQRGQCYRALDKEPEATRDFEMADSLRSSPRTQPRK